SGKTTFNTLDLKLALSKASSQYLTNLFTGDHLTTLVLARTDAAGNVVGNWSFGMVLVTDVAISGTPDDGTVQTMSLAYGQLAVRPDPATKTVAAWNVVDNRVWDDPVFEDQTLGGNSAAISPFSDTSNASTDAAPTGMTLTLTGGNGTAITAPIDLNSY